MLTTLHTNDAVAAVTRLVDMGVEPFLVASSLTLVVGQRLVRRPCKACAAPYVPSERTLVLLGITEADLASATPVRGRGCSDCSGTGYRGRVGVFEVLPVTAQLRQVLLTTPTEEAIGAAARAHGMLTLRASALAAAHRGMTTYEEVLRATHVDTVSGPRCPSCARALADEMVCCPYDGTLVGRDRCTGCEKPLDAEWSTCPWCRTPVVLDDAAEDAVVLPQVVVVGAGTAALVEQALDGTADVVAAATADDALALVAQGEVAVVLVDEELPDLSGLELVRLLQSEHGEHAPALLLRTDDEELADEVGEEDGVDVLGTAVTGQELADRLRPLLTASS